MHGIFKEKKKIEIKEKNLNEKGLGSQKKRRITVKKSNDLSNVHSNLANIFIENKKLKNVYFCAY